MLEKFICQQCGANKYSKVNADIIQCEYCETTYRIIDPTIDKPKLLIKKGANVVFGKNANVTVNGGIKIDEGAHVQFHGKLEIIQKGNEEKIKKAKYKKEN